MLCVSRAPLETIEAYRRRKGWCFPWVSSLRSDFNFDFGVSFTEEQRSSAGTEYNFRPIDKPYGEMPGLSAFALDDGDVYHAYSCYARGLDGINGTYQLLDLAPKRRDEDDGMAWVRRHDAYEDAAGTRGRGLTR